MYPQCCFCFFVCDVIGSARVFSFFFLKVKWYGNMLLKLCKKKLSTNFPLFRIHRLWTLHFWNMKITIMDSNPKVQLFQPCSDYQNTKKKIELEFIYLSEQTAKRTINCISFSVFFFLFLRSQKQREYICKSKQLTNHWHFDRAGGLMKSRSCSFLIRSHNNNKTANSRKKKTIHRQNTYTMPCLRYLTVLP